MNDIKLSIIVPIFNVEKYLNQCINSLIEQDIPCSEYEIILINDGSKDRSGEIAKKYSHEIENVFYYEQNNQGQAVARNHGIDKAHGKYIMFVDSDDYLERNVLKHMFQEADKNNIDILITTFKIYHADGSWHFWNDYSIYDTNTHGHEALLNGLNIGSACARLYRKSFMTQFALRFTPDMKHEDVYMNLSAYTFANIIRSINLTTYTYRWNEGSTDRTNSINSSIRGMYADIEIAKKEANMANDLNLPPKLSLHFSKLSNSLIVSTLISLYNPIHKIPPKERIRIISKMNDYKLLPINKPTMSWKTSILSRLLNLIVCCSTYSR